MENKKITGDWDGEKIWQHAKPVEDKRTLSEIKEEMMDIQGKWNGDDAGVEEDNSNTAEDILEAVKNLEELLAEIHNEDTSKYDKYELPGFKEVKDSLDNLTIRK